MDTGNEAADKIKAIRANYKEVRQRLRDPPNAIPDAGIDLRRHYIEGVRNLDAQPIVRTPPPPPPAPPTPLKNIPPCWTNRLQTNRIIDITAEHFGVTRADILGQARRAHHVRPRQMACYLLRELTHKSFPLIGRILGGKDHTTTMYSHRKIERDLKEKHRNVTAHYSCIMAIINATNPEPAVPPECQSNMALELENQKGLPQPEICVVDQGSGNALVDTKTAKLSNYFWPIYGGDRVKPPRQETPRYRQSYQGLVGFYAELADCRERQILAWSSTSVG